jgi:hypothetical protein
VRTRGVKQQKREATVAGDEAEVTQLQPALERAIG